MNRGPGSARRRAASAVAGRLGRLPSESPDQMPPSESDSATRNASHEQVANPVLYVLAAWLVPGAGHFLLGRRWRALVFLGLVVVSAAVGVALEGRLFVVVADQPLSRLGTLASMAMGVLYFVLRYAVGYEGNLLSATYEYGTAFLLTAGLMNLLVILDTWDIAHGRKE